jgi:hypothetical protein
MNWVTPLPDRYDAEDLTWYMDGSAMNGRWHELATTGFGIVVTASNGEIIACAQGSPPAWVRTAAAAEAWALLQAVTANAGTPKMVTDCKSLLSTAAAGRKRATGHRQVLARIWTGIASALDDDTRSLVDDQKLRWIPAHLGESAIGRELEGGRTFTATDWRANRLADALAKEASARDAISKSDAELLKSAEDAAKHACALLGVVTQAANNHRVEVANASGQTWIVAKRDTIDERPRQNKRTATACDDIADAVWDEGDIDLGDASLIELELALSRSTRGTRDSAESKRSREANRRKREKIDDERKTDRLIKDIASQSRLGLDTARAGEKLQAMLDRTRTKEYQNNASDPDISVDRGPHEFRIQRNGDGTAKKSAKTSWVRNPTSSRSSGSATHSCNTDGVYAHGCGSWPPSSMATGDSNETDANRAVLLNDEHRRHSTEGPSGDGNAAATCLAPITVSSDDEDQEVTVVESLLELHGDGIAVRWPNGLDPLQAQQIVATDQKQVIACPRPGPDPLASAFNDRTVSDALHATGLDIDVIADLLELDRGGARVAWPDGLNPLVATQLLQANRATVPSSVGVASVASELCHSIYSSG